MKSLALLILIPSLAMATVKPDLPVKPKPEAPVTTVTSSSNSAAASTSTAASSSASEATGGSATSGGNSFTVTESNPRQAPSVGQGSLYIPTCGAAGNAGGSKDSGSMFLGIAFTPKDCKLLLAAASYQALGMVDSACQMLNGVSAVKARWKEIGMDPPSCTVLPPVAVPTSSSAVQVPKAGTTPVVSVPRETECASKEYVGEVVGRAVKACVSK